MGTQSAQPEAGAAAAPAGKNAVERRLDTLLEQWTAFAQDPAARVLAWTARDDERSMLNAFFTVQSDPGAESPDFFVRLSPPLETPGAYASALVLRLAELYDEVRPQLKADGVSDAWAVPADVLSAAKAGRATIEQWLAVLGAFSTLYCAGEALLAVSIEPTPVPAAKAWAEWLKLMLSSVAGVPPRVRLIVLDAAEGPVIPKLAAALPAKDAARVKVVPCGLNMPEALQELAATGAVPAAGGGGGGPGPAFRRLFVALTGALGGGDIAAGTKTAESALAIAREQGWPHMQAAVHMALGAGLLGAGKVGEAVTAYKSAGATCAAVLTAPDGGASAGPGVAVALAKVGLHARLGEAVALYSADRFTEAAAVYEAAAPVAAGVKDPGMVLECWRMACHCHARAKQTDEATRCGKEGLKAAAALDPPVREASTLPYLARELATLHGGGSGEGRSVRTAIAGVMGPDWEKQVAALDGGAATPADAGAKA